MFSLKNLIRPTITRKILIGFMTVSLVPVLFVGYVTYKTSEKEIKKEALKNLLAFAESKDVLFNAYIMGKKRDARELALTPTVISMSEKHHDAFHVGEADSREYTAMERKHRKYFMDFINKFKYHDLLFVDTAGNIFFTVKREDDLGTNLYTGTYKDTWLAKTYRQVMETKEINVSDFKHYLPSNMPALFIVTPVFSEGNIIGAVILQISNEDINEEVQNYIGLGRTGEIVIASREGNEAVFIAPLRHDTEAAFNRRVRIGSEEALPIQKAIQGENGSGLSVDYRNKEILAVWRYLPYVRWGMVVKIDADEAYEHIYNIKKWTAIVGATTIIVVTLLAIRISRTITNPVRALHKGSEIIGSGNLDHKVGTDAKDEIGDLSRSFDEMTIKLKDSRMMLEDEITERKKAERQIKEALKEKEILLQEIHHRVKNNMMVIISLLQLQSKGIKDKQYREMFSDSVNRINTMAIIHEKLYRSKDMSNVNFDDYLKSMLNSMLLSYRSDSLKIELKTDVDNVSLGVNTAIPCGLIINELISNSLKHAFPEGNEGEIRVAMFTNDKAEIKLTVSDNGIGIPENLDFRDTDSLGLTLVNALTAQLRGTIDLNREKGTRFVITFKG